MSETPEAPPTEEEAPYKPVSRWAIVFFLRTRRGLDLMDRLGRWKVSKPLGWFMLFLMPIAGAVALYVIFTVLAVYVSPRGAVVVSNIRTISPLANFLLPGINPYLPLSVWLAVVVAVVIHESAHGIVARSLGLRIKSVGVLLLLFLPIGAFVEVDDKQLKQTRSRDSLRVLAAGSGINFIVGLVCIVLLLVTVSSMVPATKGAGIMGVVPNSPSYDPGLHSPAYLAGIQPGDFVTAINNTPITSLDILHDGNYSVGEDVNMTVWHAGTSRTVNIVLANYTYTIENLTSGRTSQVTYPFLGVEQQNYSSLQAISQGYATGYKVSPLAYIGEIPTFAAEEVNIPFSDELVHLYASPLGAWTPAVTESLFWLFFVNFNLAIFNALPIYPMDGGQAFESFLRGAGGGRISEDLARRVTTGVTLAIFFALFILIAGPYISAYTPT